MRKILGLICIMAALPAIAGDGWSLTLELQGWNTDSGLRWDQGGQGTDVTEHTTDFPDEEILPSFAAHLTLHRFFVSVSKAFATEYTGVHDLRAVVTTSTPTSTQTDVHQVQYDSKLERDDLDLTLGWVVGNGFIVIGGYKSIEFTEDTAELSYTLTTTLQGSEGDPIVDSDDVVDPSRRFSESYDYSGPFVGVAYGKRWQKFTFSGNVAYADLDGDYRFSSVFAADPDVPGDTDQALLDNGSSSADGISFTLTGTYAVTDAMGISLGYKHQDYSADKNGDLLIPSLDANGLVFGVRYTF